MITDIYKVGNRGISDGFTRIFVYNWHSIKQIDNVRWDDSETCTSDDYLVAIWKIKPKNNEKEDYSKYPSSGSIIAGMLEDDA